MIPQIFAVVVAVAILALPDNLASLVKPREKKADEHEKPRNRNRRGSGRRRSGGTRPESNAGKLDGSSVATLETTNDAISENRSGGAAGGGGGEPDSASQGSAGLITPPPENGAGSQTAITS